jgi:hypothetical protein
MSFACEYCGKPFEKPVTSGHKRKCPQFLAANPDRGVPPCLCGHEEASATSMKRHRQGCDVWKARDVQAVRIDRYVGTLQKHFGEGVTNPIHVESIRQKKAATVKERYGSENVFSKESSIYDQVQSHWEGKDRTAHLPKDNFARPEIKEKIRDYWQRTHGVDGPSQVPEIRAKQLRTTLERYGDEQGLRVPEIRERGRETMLRLYGVEDAAQSPDIRLKIQETNMERYGVPWTTIHPETREKQYVTQVDNFGGLFFSTDVGKEICRETWPERKIRIEATNMTRYGAPHPMQNREYAANHLLHSRRAGPNSIERRLQELFPQLMFTGDGSYWRFLERLGKNKNPDFVLPGPDPERPFSGATAVVEVFGDYWHGEAMTGKPCVEHELETVAAWNDAGLRCLVVWENEFSDEPKMFSRVKGFLGTYDGG